MSFRAGNDNNNNKNFSKNSFMLSPWGGFHRWRRTLFFYPLSLSLPKGLSTPSLSNKEKPSPISWDLVHVNVGSILFLSYLLLSVFRYFFNVANSLGLESFFPLPTCYMKGLRLGNNCYGIVRVLIVSRSWLLFFLFRSEKLLSLFLEVEVLCTRVGWLLMVIK